MSTSINIKDKPRGRVVIDPNAKPLTPEMAVKCVFGISFDQLVEEIRINAGGKYDSLYIDTPPSSEGR